MFDAEKFCRDHSIEIASKGHPHNRRGWINVSCPYCSGHHGFHMGINLKNAYASCYRCGWTWLPKLIATLTKSTITIAIKKISEYSTGEIYEEYQNKTKGKDELIYPIEFKKLEQPHWNYLIKRNYKPSTARSKKLLGTLMQGEYAMRIIIPVYLDNILVSYQGRDITGKHKTRYKSCEQSEEVIFHRDTVYGIDECNSDKILIVEGPLDQWRMGINCGATFGIEWSTAQARLIASRFKKFFILYDNEEQAQEKALLLYHYLTARGLDGEIIDLNSDKDPDQLTDKQAYELKGDLGLL